MDTCTLPAPNPDPLSPRTSIPTNQHLVQPQTGTFITEAAWGLASKSSIDVAHGRLVPDCWGGEKSEDLSSAEPTASCSCSSSTSLVRNGGDSNLGTRMALLTRRRTADTLPQAEQGSASMSVMQSRAHSNRSDEFHKRDQTARVPLEAPMLANVIVSIQASTRRFSAANNERSCFFTYVNFTWPTCSVQKLTHWRAMIALARRNLLISKKGTQNTTNRELESAATII